MKKLGLALLAHIGWALAAAHAHAAVLTSLHQIHLLNNQQAEQHLAVDFEATVTYFRDYESTLFVQDGEDAIFVLAPSDIKLIPGDRIRIKGITQSSFRPLVSSHDIRLLHHGKPVDAVQANYDELIHARFDCRLVTIRARVLSSDITLSSNQRSTTMQMLTSSGPIDAIVDSDPSGSLSQLLDAEVEVTGAASGHFDGKMQMTGILLHAQNASYVRVIHPASGSAWKLPITPMDEILSSYRVKNLTERVNVEGVITYYQPGAAAVLQNGQRSLWIDSKNLAEVKIGDHAIATGFPEVHDGFLRLAKGEIVADTRTPAPIAPLLISAHDLTHSTHIFDLVSVKAKVVAQVREGGQDEYVLLSGNTLFSALARYSTQYGAPAPPPAKTIPLGSTVQVTGICIQENSNPFDREVPFHLLLRSFEDVQVIAQPSWISVGNLARLVSVLLAIVLIVASWGWMLKRKVRQQTAALAKSIETEAALERRNAQIEQRRSRILEDINGSRPLAEVLEEITELISFHLNGAPCWCEVTDGARLGQYQPEFAGKRLVREEIPGRSGLPLGSLHAALDAGVEASTAERQAFVLGARLATLAIETRRLYSDLVRRSEFDLLTDVHNRFSLDKHLDELIAHAREHASIFGLIYIDLDEFKQVNDQYGHHIGDLYLREAATRMRRTLRGGDLLARLGGDEFAAIVPTARNRSEVEEIAVRLRNCFLDPFQLEGVRLQGTASVGFALYPEDANNKSTLLSAADTAMYLIKNKRPIVRSDRATLAKAVGIYS